MSAPVMVVAAAAAVVAVVEAGRAPSGTKLAFSSSSTCIVEQIVSWRVALLAADRIGPGKKFSDTCWIERLS